jgi:uncharacterized Fe-S cluster-containing radical SAM superfamily enzyme
MTNIINIKPEGKKTVFKDENFVNNNQNFNEKLVLNKIKNVYLKKNNLGNIDKNIFNIVINSYVKISKNQKLDKKDFILSKQELSEFSKISDQNIIRYILYRYKYNKYPELNIVGEFPPCVQIEPTSICNLRCVMCYQADKTFSNKSKGFMGHMSLDLFKKIIDQIEGNIEAVTLASRGEPSLNPNLDGMLKYCDGKFLGLKINTNATMLNERLINQLLSSDLQTLIFSIDEKDKENYEKIRINAKFETIMKNLELFREIKEKKYKNTKINVRISGVKINSNQNINEISNFYKEFADQVSLVNFNPWQSSYENEVNDIKEVCSELYRRMFIWWDGKVNPCDYDYKSLLSKWNVNSSSVDKIWNSNYYNELRELHISKNRKKIEPCNRCASS